MTQKINVDVLVIGAGIAGCHAAALLAEAGLKVALIDKKKSSLAGPQWINAVPLWMFDEAALERPQGQEVFDINDRFIIRAPDKKSQIVIDKLGVADVHMGLLGKRLKQQFFEHQGIFLQMAMRSCHIHNDRLVEIIGESEQGVTVSIVAQHFIDAAGMRGTAKRFHQSRALWAAVQREDICTAAQRTLDIRDREGALSFLAREKIAPGDVLSDVGFMGGFSLFRVQIDKELNHISILCGLRSMAPYQSASHYVNDFIRNNSWIGKAFIDGRGALPLNAPYAHLSSKGLALLGDAACQVYAAHGSGIGIGLIAARFLADAVINNSPNLISYPREFHRRYFQRLYFAEHFRRFSQTLSPTAMSKLMSSGMLNAALARQTLMQENPKLTLAELRNLFAAVKNEPKLFISMLPTLTSALVGKIKAKKLF